MKTIKTVLAAITFICFSSLAQAEIVPPNELIKQVADEVLEIIKNDKDIQNGDMKKIATLTEDKILPHFDFERMSRITLGKHWAEASPAQQDAFVKEFRSLTVRIYSSALSKYSNRTIKYKPFLSQPGDTGARVKTLILQPDGESIPVEYLLEKESNEWKVFDVVIADVSMVNAHRGEYSTEIRRNGMDELIRKLAEKNNR